MKVWKFKKRIEIDKTICNFHIETFHYGSFENDKPKHWTELHCWYECDCERCPLSWEVRGYDDVDCGCYMAEYGDYPKTALICMLPRWIKKILLKHKQKSEKQIYKEYEAKIITRGNCMICGKELTEGLFICKECGDKANKESEE